MFIALSILLIHSLSVSPRNHICSILLLPPLESDLLLRSLLAPEKLNVVCVNPQFGVFTYMFHKSEDLTLLRLFQMCLAREYLVFVMCQIDWQPGFQEISRKFSIITYRFQFPWFLGFDWWIDGDIEMLSDH